MRTDEVSPKLAALLNNQTRLTPNKTAETNSSVQEAATKIMADNAAWPEELFLKIGLSDNYHNRLILKYLIANQLEVTKAQFDQVERLLKAISSYEGKLTTNETSIMASALALKLGWATAAEAVLATYLFLKEGPNLLATLQQVENNLNLLFAGRENQQVQEILQEFNELRNSFQVDQAPDKLLKLAQALLQTPESLISAGLDGQKEINLNLVDRLEKLIVFLQKTSGVEESLQKETVKLLSLIKNVLVGNFLINTDDQLLEQQVFIPFFFNRQPCRLKIIHRKKEKNSNQNSPLKIDLTVEHQTLGKISFLLLIVNREITAEITAPSVQTLELLKINQQKLIEKISLLNFRLTVNSIHLAEQQELEIETEESLPQLVLPYLDILV